MSIDRMGACDFASKNNAQQDRHLPATTSGPAMDREAATDRPAD